MQLGSGQPSAPPSSMIWRGTQKSALAIVDWARDEALLMYAAATPPDRNDPESTWTLKIKTAVPAEQGGGDQWTDVPKGATILHSGTWVEPTFAIRESPFS